MNIKKMNLLIDSINHCIYAYVITLIACPLVYAITQDKKRTYLSILILPILLVTYYVKSFCKISFIYIILHMMLFVGILLSPISLVLKVIFGIVLIVYGTISFFNKAALPTQDKEMPSFYLLIPIIVCQIIYNRVNYTFLSTYLLYGFLICSVLYFISYYLINSRRYYLYNYEKTNAPLSEQRKVQNKLVTFFISITGIFLYVLSRFQLSRITNFLGSLILCLLRFLVSLIPQSKEDPGEIIYLEPEQTLQRPDFLIKGPNLFFRILNNLLVLAVVVVTIIIIVKLILPLFQYLRKYVYRSNSSTATIEKEYLSPFKKETKKANSSDGFLPNKLFPRSNYQDRIRKHFYKQLKPKIDTQTAAVHTSKELTHSLIEPTSGLKVDTYSSSDLERLRTLYDKARYSNEECTKQDYQAMKKLNL